jgi:hypothetical protein
MFEKVKEHLNEVINIANKCPEKYQEKCFEILFSSLVRPAAPPGAAAVSTAGFFSDYGITEKEWQRVFQFDGKSYSIIVRDLKAKGKAPRQVRLALLVGAKALLETSEAAISRDSLVEFCKTYAAYDSKNFKGNMKKQKDLFLPRDDDWVLTTPGQAKAAEVIKELAQ